MNTKKTGAVALSAVALIVLVSGCAGSRVDAGSGQSSITSLQNQADTQRQEMAELRARLHSVPLDAGKLAANEAIRSDKQASVQSSVSAAAAAAAAAEAIRLDKQQSVTPNVSAAEAQGDRLAKQAEAYRAQVEEDALKRVADEERRAQHPEQQW